MRRITRTNVLYIVVGVIALLLVTNIFLTYRNNIIIEKNQEIERDVDQARFYYDQIGKNIIHSADLGVRAFALVQTPKMLLPLNNSIKWQDSIFFNTETALRKLNYDLSEFYVFRDSVRSYITYCQRMKSMIDAGNIDEFRNTLAKDKGGHLWYQYILLEQDMSAFTNELKSKAKTRYEQALDRNQAIQIILFLICVPTLLVTASYSVKSMKLTELLRMAEAEKSKMLQEQNMVLERKISERMQEIMTQNEEISMQNEQIAAQRDALAIQNKQLQEAQHTIELQHLEIQSMNQQLRFEVQNRTAELREANKELLDQNNQLEQYAFIAAHNLRAPLARILGLADLLQITPTKEEQDQTLEKLVTSTRDLDQVIRDLNTILNIKKHNSNLTEVDLVQTLARIQNMLEREIQDSGAIVQSNFDEVSTVYAVAPYVESILYNLINNAIKYRDPERSTFILLETTLQEEYICLTVSDNGLGIDLYKHRQNIFSLYKRFHLHMEGRGLGLYLVKTQIQSMGGKIDVKSEPNEGTTFYVYFKRYLF